LELLKPVFLLATFIHAMYQSFFSYTLTRSYPYKWFTWVVVIGGVAATIFFSLLNLAANGYQLEVVYTTDPNGTLAENQWFQKPPWTLMAKVEASCQSQNLALNTGLFTTQLGLTYTLSNVWSHEANGSTNIYPSLTYRNNTLDNCSVNNIYIHAENTNTNGNSPFWAWLATTISAVATCSVDNGKSPSFFNMTVQYEASPTTDSAYNDGALGASLSSTGFLHLDQTKKPCIWWGEQLLHMWYYNVLNVLGPPGSNEDATVSSTISTLRLALVPTGSKDITNYDFFNITGWFNMADGSLDSFQSDGSVEMSATLGGYDVGFQMHHFATVFYSTLLSDLGQPNGPNILTDGNLIQQYVLAGWNLSSLPAAGSNTTAQQAFDQLIATTPPLVIQPSTFNSQYICQVPRRRNMGSLFIAVLVADMVFLQTLFKLLTWTTTWWVKRTDEESNLCDGCKRQLAGGPSQAEAIALLPMSRKGNKLTRDELEGTPAVSVSSRPVTLGESE
jgi:hypothetical protein